MSTPTDKPEIKECRRCKEELDPELIKPVCPKCDYLKGFYCPDCQRQVGSGPGHDGSSLCLSGSLASGGNRSHCTCNTCF